MDELFKKCRTCGEWKLLSKFTHNWKMRDSYAAECRECVSALNALRYAKRKAQGGRGGFLEYRDIWANQTYKAKYKEPSNQGMVSRRYISDLWDRQEGRCSVTDISFTPKFNLEKSPWPHSRSPSLDRIDNAVRYLDGNLRIVVHAFNDLKSTATDAEALILAERIVRGLEGNAVYDPGISDLTLRNKWSENKLRDTKRGKHPYSMTLRGWRNLWDTQEGRCAITGHLFAPFVRTEQESMYSKSPYSPSGDRIANSVGYHDGNLRIVVDAFNAFKGIGTDAEALVLARLIVRGLAPPHDF